MATTQAGDGQAPTLILRRGSDVETRVSLTRFREAWFIDLRTWWLPPGSREFRPTKKGVSIPIESLDQVIEALERIREHLDQQA